MPRVLIASCEAFERLLLCEILHVIPNLGFFEAVDGMSAIDWGRQLHPRIMMLDYMLPKLNGIEACRVMKADPAFSGVSVMVVTAMTDLAFQKMAYNAGADAVLVKPFDEEELLAVVKHML